MPVNPVNPRFSPAPGVVIVDGARAPIPTARHAEPHGQSFRGSIRATSRDQDPAGLPHRDSLPGLILRYNLKTQDLGSWGL